MPCQRNSSCLPLPFSRRARAFSLALIASAAIAVGAVDSKRSFNVASDVAERALRKFADQAGIHLIFSPDITDGLRTQDVKGELSVDDAADRLLDGTNLKLVADKETGVYALARITPQRGNAPKTPRRPHGEDSGESLKKKEPKPTEPKNP